jgi:agmatinase
MIANTALILCLTAFAAAHGDHDDQEFMSGPHQALWYNTLPGDGGTQADSVFSGISTFGRLPYRPCLSHKEITYDIAFIGELSRLPQLPGE